MFDILTGIIALIATVLWFYSSTRVKSSLGYDMDTEKSKNSGQGGRIKLLCFNFYRMICETELHSTLV